MVTTGCMQNVHKNNQEGSGHIVCSQHTPNDYCTYLLPDMKTVPCPSLCGSWVLS